MTPVAEQHESLWILTASPVAWAAHFLLCYVTAAVFCAKQLTPHASLLTVRMAIAVYTIAALVTIGIVAWIGFRAHRYGSEPPPHDSDSPEDRHRFIGFATLLLSGLSAVAVFYAALVAVFVQNCE